MYSSHIFLLSDLIFFPQDFFTFSYPSYPASVQNWQFRPTHGMGYGMQYPPAATAMVWYITSERITISSRSVRLFDDSF